MAAAELDIVLGAKVEPGITNINKFNNALVKTEKTADQFAGKTKTNFTGLNRVIQDLPFGFIAIQNNIEQLFPAAGSLGLAISVITAAITFSKVGFSNWYRAVKESKEASDEFSKGLRGAEQSILSNVSKLNAYVAIARDNTKSIKERNYAIDEANKLMGEHGKKLDLVNINTAAATAEIDKFSKALLAEAIAAKYADRVADLTIKQKDATKDYSKAIGDLNKSVADQKASQSDVFSFIENVFSFKEQIGAVNDASGAIEKHKQTTADLTEAQKDFNSANEEAVRLFSELGTKVKETKPKKVSDFFLADTNIKNIPDKFIDQIAIDTGDHIHSEIQKNLDAQPPLKVPPFDFDKTDLGKKAADMAALINDTIVNAAVAAGQVIGNLLSGQKNPFSAMFEVIGAGIKSLGKQLIEVGVLALGIKSALKSLLANPYLSIAAGIAAVALGTIISNKANNIKAFASGGVVTSPTLALIGERGPERITPLGYEGSFSNTMAGELTTRISGQDLYIVLNRYNQNRNNIN